MEWWLEHRHGWLVKRQWAWSILGCVSRDEYQVLGSTSIPARLDTLVYWEPFSWLTSVGTTLNTVITHYSYRTTTHTFRHCNTHTHIHANTTMRNWSWEWSWVSRHCMLPVAGGINVATITKCGMKWLIHPQTSTVQFGNFRLTLYNGWNYL